MRYNTLICKEVYDVLGIVPDFVTTYNARKFAFPELVQKNDKGKFVLFGGYPKTIDKKEIIWQQVCQERTSNYLVVYKKQYTQERVF